jgi:hypothetical protein
MSASGAFPLHLPPPPPRAAAAPSVDLAEAVVTPWRAGSSSPGQGPELATQIGIRRSSFVLVGSSSPGPMEHTAPAGPGTWRSSSVERNRLRTQQSRSTELGQKNLFFTAVTSPVVTTITDRDGGTAPVLRLSAAAPRPYCASPCGNLSVAKS